MTMKKIVLPEGDSKRVLLAAQMLIGGAVCHPILIGDPVKISAELGADSSSYTVEVPNGTEFEKLKTSAEDKGKEFRVKDEVSTRCIAQGAALVRDGFADGIVSGAQATTDDVFRVYIKTIGTKNGVSRVTSCFLMEKGSERYIFADCGLNVHANAEQLAESAFLCAEYAKTVNIDPVVAFLSFQTVGNAQHPEVQIFAESARISRETYNLRANGPLQADAALLPEVAQRKTQDSDVAGHANVLMFPDLNSGNIAYKLVEILGGFNATGPLFLGFAKPAYDLSRSCSKEDIVSAVREAVKKAS